MSGMPARTAVEVQQIWIYPTCIVSNIFGTGLEPCTAGVSRMASAGKPAHTPIDDAVICLQVMTR